MSNQISATIISVATNTKEKSNGNKFRYATLEILEGPAKGMKVLGIRTLGEGKKDINTGDKCEAYLAVDAEDKPVLTETGAPIFNISLGQSVTEGATVLAALGL